VNTRAAVEEQLVQLWCETAALSSLVWKSGAFIAAKREYAELGFSAVVAVAGH
jgi:hypothetical protein